MVLPDPRNMTPRQRIAAGVAAACIALAGVGIKVSEGYSNTVYPDVVLKWNAPTICTGHVDKTLKPGTVYTDEQCETILTQDVREKTYDAILPCIGDVPMSDNELAAFLRLAFNIGPTNFCKSSIPVKLKAGNHAAACATISLYRFVGAKDCAIRSNNCIGIVTRRASERQLCETP